MTSPIETAELGRGGQISEIFDAMLEGIVLVDVTRDAESKLAKGRVTAVNHAFEQIVQRPAAELVGRTLRALFGGPSRLDAYQRVLDTGEPCVVEVWNEQLQKLLKISVVRPRPGQLLFGLVDITEQHRTAERLHAAEERFRRAFGIMTDRVVLYDRELRVIFANPTALRGRPLSAVAGKHTTEAFPAVADGRYPALLDEVRARLEPRVEELRVDYPDLGVRWFRVEAAPIFDAAGALCEVLVHSRDITAEQGEAQAIAERLALAEQLRQLGESVPGVLYSYHLAPDGKATMPFATAAAIDVLGHSPEEIARDLGLVAARYHPEDAPAMRRGVMISARDLTPWHAAFRYLHPTRGLRYIEGWSQPTREADGGVLWHGFLWDVTERERANQLLRDREEQLRAAQRMEAVGRLAGGVAHDFNNLLTVIRSYADLALSTVPEGDELRSDLDEIRGAADRAAGLTRQLLAFSRKQVLMPRVIDLNDLCAGSLKLLQRLLGEDIEIVYRPSPTLAATRADPGQIEQVIMNLAINARDAMPGGGKLTIETENIVLDDDYCRLHVEARPGPHVMLAVSDTGCGMDEATQARIFEPFFTTKEVGKGTGLGLATVYGIVAQSGGSIYVYSEPNRGTTFKVYLPREAAGEAAISPRVAPRPAKGNEVLLVVEDEAPLRSLLLRLLKPLGYEVLLAKDGATALEVAASRSDIHLLLTDVVMPGMSGRELAIRLCAARPALKVLYMSGYTENAIEHHGVLDEGVQLLPKPFTAEALATKLREVLDGA
ncbi:MAG: ATP-binding protein [Byssovorax sp.]